MLLMRRIMRKNPMQHSYRDKVRNEDIVNFFGMIHNIDENVGRLREQLKNLGIERETLLVLYE